MIKVSRIITPKDNGFLFTEPNNAFGALFVSYEEYGEFVKLVNSMVAKLSEEET